MSDLTATQRGIFFSWVKTAAAECGEDSDTYRKRIMREELGVDHLSEVSRTSGFDKLMCRVLKDSGEFALALPYVAGNENRLRYLVVEAAKKIVGTTDLVAASRYIAGVAVNMRFSRQTVDALAMQLQRDDGWDDFTELQLKKLVAALNTHIRRHS